MNNKSKVSYHLSKTEFWMLIILAAVVLVALSVIYLITPAMDALALTKQEYEMANARLEILRQDNARLQEYLTQEAEADTQLTALQEKMPPYYSQEITLGTFDALAQKNMLEIVSVNFSGVNVDTREAFLATIVPQQGEQAAAASDAEAADVTDLVRYETIDIAFTGSYGAIYGFVGDLANETRAIFTRELMLSRAQGGTTAGTITLLLISGVQAEGEYPGYTYDGAAATGKQDPFTAFPGYIEALEGENVAVAALAPDFYVILNTYDDNAAKLIMSRYGDGSSALSSQDNKKLEASILLEEKDGKITYTYELGSKKHSGTVTPSQEHPDELVVSILSTARKNGSDNVGLKLSVTNKTGYLVIIDVHNDDASSPRFELGAVQGSVQVGK